MRVVIKQRKKRRQEEMVSLHMKELNLSFLASIRLIAINANATIGNI